jgi:hypothetical protein
MSTEFPHSNPGLTYVLYVVAKNTVDAQKIKFHVNVVQSILEKLEDHWILESASTEEIG